MPNAHSCTELTGKTSAAAIDDEPMLKRALQNGNRTEPLWHHMISLRRFSSLEGKQEKRSIG